MSFGFAIGDFLAVLGLFERIAIELKNYRDAPVRFQNLSLELDMLRSTLRHVLQAQTDDQADSQVDRKILEQIRAIVLHCHQPLQAFIDKLRSKDRSLGHYRTTRLNDVGIRMKWSMVTQKDVEELRKVLLSEMVAINMLLSMQQLTNLRELSARTIDFRQNSDAILNKTSIMFDIIQGLPESIANMHSTIAQNGEHHTKQNAQMTQMVANLSSQVIQVTMQGESSMEMMRSGRTQIMRAVARLSSVLSDLRKLLYLLSKYSKDMLEAISQNTRMLLDIASHMKRLARAIESIPLHLSLNIIRLDDALGESWGLPFQACQTWESFKDILKVVVYGNQRPGLDYIMRDQFRLTLAKTGHPITRPDLWTSTVRAGAHIKQAMVIPELPFVKDSCPYPSCSGTLLSQADEMSSICSRCGRLSSATVIHPPLLKYYAEAPLPAPFPTSDPSQTSQPRSHAPAERIRSGVTIGPMKPCADSVDLFRSIQVYEQQPPLTSEIEAYEKLREDAFDFQANLYLGWHALSSAWREEAIQRLERAIMTEPNDWIPWYLLARAYTSGDRMREAYDALQQCVYREGRIPDVWITIGVMYFQMNQPRDSLDALARSIRICSNAWESWYNLGVLYESHNQVDDALDSLQRALDLNPRLSNVRFRMLELQAGVSSDPDMVECALLHISDPVPIFEEDTEIQINPLKFPDEEWEDVEDDFESENEDDHDAFEIDPGS